MKQNRIRCRILAGTCVMGVFLAPFLFAQSADPGSGDAAVRQWLNLDYAGDGLKGHRLDIFLPPEGDPPFPVIVTIAGSAFFSNDSKPYAFRLGKIMLGRGFAVAAVNHRSSREAVFPAHVNDVKGVVRFLRAHASSYGLDTSFIGIAGNSSGGNLAAMLGTSGGVRVRMAGRDTFSIEGSVGGNLGESSRVDAVADWYGPTDFLKMDSCGSTMNHDAPESPESVYIGGPIQNRPELCGLANPAAYADPGDPPFWIIHGDADPLVPLCQSVILYETLKKNGVACEMTTVPGGGHGGPWEDAYREKMASFFIDAMHHRKTP